MDHRTWWKYSQFGEKRHYVKNLAWLHRHATEVYAITYYENDGVMLANMHGGRYYRTQWNSRDVFNGWYRNRFADTLLSVKH